MKRVDLVFRTVGERTSDLALELAVQHVRPNRVHVIRDVRPFRETVRRQLEIQHDADSVVYVDADCLICEDLRPFLEWNERPYVDCYVHDRFRGRIHCGVHITRIDLVRAMQEVVPPDSDLAYVLRPESRLRNLALRGLGENKSFRGFRILHDHYQWYRSIWEKYALRELRSRTDTQRARLHGAMAHWGDEPDFVIARAAIRHAEAHVPAGADPEVVDRYIGRLQELADAEVPKLSLPPQGPLRRGDVVPPEERSLPRVFGLGLSRTGTRSLTAALHCLGWDTVHYPTDVQSLRDLERGDGRFALLEHYDGLTDITASPYYAQLDANYPGSKFVLTVRDEDAWIRSARNHWAGRPAHNDSTKDEVHLRVRRLLRAATYGCYEFQEQRFRWVYRQHLEAVKRYFAGRPEDLLLYPLCEGAGWEPLCEFLGVPCPSEPFPHKGRKVSARAAQLEVHD